LSNIKAGAVLDALATLLKTTISFVLSRLSAWNTLAGTGRIFMKFDI
jgi:hypothetical protein